jgi:hypothetical protein
VFECEAKYPTVREFRNWLTTGHLSELVDKWIFGGAVYAFERNRGAMELLTSHLAERIQTSPENIRVVGSAKLGFSLNPDTFSRIYTDDSDIDVIIVDDRLFDAVWHSMLRWNYPRRLDRLIAPDFQFRRARLQELYWGWFRPDRVDFAHVSYVSLLRLIQDLKFRWFDAFRSLSRHQEFARRDVSGRLYRTWDLARLYHEHGLWLVQTAR